MAQTPITKAIEQLKEKIENSNYALYAKGCEDAIDILTALLPYEREIIESAYQLGDDDANRENIGDVGDRQYINKKDYFITTYNIQPK